MSGTESSSSSSSAEHFDDSDHLSDNYEDEEEEDCITVAIETAHFRSILQCFNEIAKYTFFYFDKYGMIMFPQDILDGEVKKNKKKEDENKSYNEPRVVCHLDKNNIHYDYSISGDRIFISFVTKDIIQEIKQYGKKETLVLKIEESNPTVINFTTSQKSATLSNLTTINGNSVVDSIYEPLEINDLGNVAINLICNVNDYKRILGGIGTGTAKSHIECTFRIKRSGFVIESKAGNRSQTYELGRARLSESSVKEYRWSRSTINALKKLQSCDGNCTLSYREDETFTIERKIVNIGTVTFLF